MISIHTQKQPLVLIPIILTLVLSGCSKTGLFRFIPQLGDTKVRELDGSIMVFVPGGEFMMGIDYLGMRSAIQLCKLSKQTTGPGVCGGTPYTDEMPSHQVTLDGYWIDQTEVTNSQYERCVDDGVCTPPSDTSSYTRETYFGDPLFVDYPVVWVSHDQAIEFCTWAGGRLPTEAEWEYAARGPENMIFPWGDEFDPSRSNYCDASSPLGVTDPTFDDGFPETAPVGSYPTGVSWCNALDMAGNVREWVADWFSYYTADPQVNPTGPNEGKTFLTKGGCWLDTPVNLRSSNRGENTPDYIRHKVGFRCVVDLD